MHFVDSKKCETDEIKKFLTKKNTKYKAGWERYVEKKNKDIKAKQPTDSYWRELKKELSICFLNNCGYCGKSVIFDDSQKISRNEGDIDHFIPKSKDATKVYAWENYIWSCSTCNSRLKQAKSNFLNPTVKSDCACIYFSFLNYEYIFKTESKFENLKNKYENTVQTFSLNSNESFSKRRRILFKEIVHYVTSIEFYKKHKMKNEYNQEIFDLKEKLENTDFKLLAKEIFIPKLQNEYPSFNKIVL